MLSGFLSSAGYRQIGAWRLTLRLLFNYSKKKTGDLAANNIVIVIIIVIVITIVVLCMLQWW